MDNPLEEDAADRAADLRYVRERFMGRAVGYLTVLGMMAFFYLLGMWEGMIDE